MALYRYSTLHHEAAGHNQDTAPIVKKSSYDYRKTYFERFDFELHDVYRALSHFTKWRLTLSQIKNILADAKI